MSNNRTRRHAIEAREPSVGREKIPATISPLTSVRLTPQIAIPLIITCGARLRERDQQISVQPPKWTEGKDNGNIYQIK